MSAYYASPGGSASLISSYDPTAAVAAANLAAQAGMGRNNGGYGTGSPSSPGPQHMQHHHTTPIHQQQHNGTNQMGRGNGYGMGGYYGDASPFGSPIPSPMGSPNIYGSRRSRGVSESGPFFRPTQQIYHIYSMDRCRAYTIRIHPKIERGFFLADGDWTCYRRNYFQLSASFTALDAMGGRVDLPCLVDTHEGSNRLKNVTGFYLGCIARTATGAREIELVQHTAKRDKGPQSLPQPMPCEAQDTSGARHESDSFHSVTYERLQFKTATANNGKRRAAQQYHVLIVELFARLEDNSMCRIATCESAPLVVRGRAPGHYAQMHSKHSPHSPESPYHSDFPSPDTPPAMHHGHMPHASPSMGHSTGYTMGLPGGGGYPSDLHYYSYGARNTGNGMGGNMLSYPGAYAYTHSGQPNTMVAAHHQQHQQSQQPMHPHPPPTPVGTPTPGLPSHQQTVWHHQTGSVVAKQQQQQMQQQQEEDDQMRSDEGRVGVEGGIDGVGVGMEEEHHAHGHESGHDQGDEHDHADQRHHQESEQDHEHHGTVVGVEEPQQEHHQQEHKVLGDVPEGNGSAAAAAAAVAPTPPLSPSSLEREAAAVEEVRGDVQEQAGGDEASS